MSERNVILKTKEKLREPLSNWKEESMLNRNIQMVYKDTDLLEKSIQNILDIKDLDELKELYSSSKTNSDSIKKIQSFYELKQKIITADYDENYVSDENMFNVFALKVANVFINEFKSLASYSELKKNIKIEDEFFEHISYQVQSVFLKNSYRTLVLDLNRCSANGKLKGNEEKDRYKFYNDTLWNDEQYIDEFFAFYPGLLRVLHNDIRKLTKIILELLTHYYEDLSVITDTFTKGNTKKIQGIMLGLGDSHSDGKRVAKVVLEDGHSIVYKPRDLRIDVLYREISQMLNSHINDEYKIQTPKVVVRKTYGWVENIEYKECCDVNGVKKFYKRMGAQLALLYSLNSIDFHSENLIASGEYPVLIDFESLFHMPYEEERTDDAFSYAKRKLSNSVKSIGLLPFIFGSNHVDVSGIGQKGKSKTFIKVPKITLNGEVKVEREYGETGGAMNHPKVAGEFVNAHDYIEEIKDGFSEMYKLILNNQQRIQDFLTNYEEQVTVRFIPKPTVRYASFLELSLHPRFLHNSMDREVFLAKIWEDTLSNHLYEKLAKHEFNDLANDDIPIFTISLNSRHLLSSNESEIYNFFKRTPLSMVEEKLSMLNREDMNLQLKLIDMSILSTVTDFLATTKRKTYSEYVSPFKEREFFVKSAEQIHKQLFSEAIVGKSEDGKNYSWINSTPIGVEEVKWSLAPMGDGLYNGLSGMAMMYLSLWIVTENDEYMAMGEDIVNDIIRRVSDWSDVNKEDLISVGAFTGISSYIYLLMNYYVATKNETYKKLVKDLVKEIPGLLENDKEYDIISGAAGAIVVLTSIYELDQDKLFLNTAEICGEYLMSNAIENDNEVSWIGISEVPLTGFSHGNAGYIYALALLEKHLNNAKISSVIKKGLAFENNRSVNDEWVDERIGNSEASAASWCHGAPGILISRMELSKNKDYKIANQAQLDMPKSLKNIAEDGFGREHSLCHGDIGNAMILIEYGRFNNDPDFINIGKNLMHESVVKGLEKGFNCGVGKGLESPNLMIGLAGVIYGLLYAIDERIPFLLDLKIGSNIPQKGA